VGSIYPTSLLAWIAAIAIVNYLSSIIVIRKPRGLYSDPTFQAANRKSFLRLLLVFIVLISPPRHPVIPMQSAAPLGSDAVCSSFFGDQMLLFPSLLLAARKSQITTNFTQKLRVTGGRHDEEAEGRSLMAICCPCHTTFDTPSI
jgi:hypothetical protein